MAPPVGTWSNTATVAAIPDAKTTAALPSELTEHRLECAPCRVPVPRRQPAHRGYAGANTTGSFNGTSGPTWGRPCHNGTGRQRVLQRLSLDRFVVANGEAGGRLSSFTKAPRDIKTATAFPEVLPMVPMRLTPSTGAAAWTTRRLSGREASHRGAVTSGAQNGGAGEGLEPLACSLRVSCSAI